MGTKKNEAGQELVRTKVNSNVYQSLIFERDVTEWSEISVAINLLLAYGLPGMAKDEALSDTLNHESVQTLQFLKNDIDKAIIHTLSVFVE